MALTKQEIGAVKVILHEMGLSEPWPLQDPALRKAIDFYLECTGRYEPGLITFFNNFGPEAQADCLRRVNAIRIKQLSRKYSAVREKISRVKRYDRER